MLSGFAPGPSFHVVGIDDFLCERGYFLQDVEKKDCKDVCDENLPKTYLVPDGPFPKCVPESWSSKKSKDGTSSAMKMTMIDYGSFRSKYSSKSKKSKKSKDGSK